jgi:hypothetical protein
MPRFAGIPITAAALVLALSAVAAGGEAGEVGAASPRPDGPLSPASLRAATVRLMEFGPRPVGADGHGPAASYVGGRFLLGGLKPILTDTFSCPAARGAAAAEDRRSSEPAVCGSVVAFGHALPLADAWSLMKGEAEAFTFARPPRPDLEAALLEAAKDEGVSRLTPFDVFKRPSPLFPRAVVRCLLRRMVRDEAAAEAEDPAARGRVMAGMLRRLARAHEAVLVTAPLDMQPAAGAGAHGADESASLTVLGAVARHLVCDSPRPRTRTLLCAALDGHWRGAAGARSLAGTLGKRCQAPSSTEKTPVPDAVVEPAEDAQLAGLLGPSSAAARAPALATALERGPADAALAAEAEDVLVRLLRLEPYAVRLVVCLDLSSGGRGLGLHLAGARGEEETALRRWLAGAVGRAQERCRASFSTDVAEGPQAASLSATAAGRAQAALAGKGRPALLVRTAGDGRGRWFTAEDTVGRMDFAALAGQARAVAALLEEILAAEALPASEQDDARSRAAGAETRRAQPPSRRWPSRR